MGAFNDRPEVRLARIGRCATAVVLIDEVLVDPQGVASAGFAQSYAQDRTNLYPGMRAPVPDALADEFRAWLTPILQRNGVLADNQSIIRDATFFSVVTTASTDLRPIQCIPHYDSTDPALFAAVIYLCDTRFSGTSFYRHRKTGYEEITESNRDNYQLALDSEMKRYGAPKQAYINGDSVLFERIFSTELRFNSAVIYPGRVLHAGNIRGELVPPKDQGDWRLTITALLQTGGCSPP